MTTLRGRLLPFALAGCGGIAFWTHVLLPAQQPSNDKATVYFYRYKQFMSGLLEPSVFCDEVELARMDNGRYFAARLTPGRHTCRSNDKQSGIELDLARGEEYFIRVDIATGLFKGHGRLVAVPREQAAFEIKRLNPLDMDKVKDPSLVDISPVDLEANPSKPSVSEGVETQTGSPDAPRAPSTSGGTRTVRGQPATPDQSAAEELTTVVLKSSPDGAEITIDGKFIGSTPSTVRLAPGDHTILIEKSGHKAWRRTMGVNPGGIVTIDATLTRLE